MCVGHSRGGEGSTGGCHGHLPAGFPLSAGRGRTATRCAGRGGRHGTDDLGQNPVADVPSRGARLRRRRLEPAGQEAFSRRNGSDAAGWARHRTALYAWWRQPQLLPASGDPASRHPSHRPGTTSRSAAGPSVRNTRGGEPPPSSTGRAPPTSPPRPGSSSPGTTECVLLDGSGTRARPRTGLGVTHDRPAARFSAGRRRVTGARRCSAVDPEPGRGPSGPPETRIVLRVVGDGAGDRPQRGPEVVRAGHTRITPAEPLSCAGRRSSRSGSSCRRNTRPARGSTCPSDSAAVG